MDHARLRVRLERPVELASTPLTLYDWPGLLGPLIHVPDPFEPSDEVPATIAAALAPGYRIVSLRPRGDAPYQVDVQDLGAMLAQFGFSGVTVVGFGVGCLTALLLAAWYPARVERLLLIEPHSQPTVSDGLASRALRDCPPDWNRLRPSVRCPVVELRWSATTAADIRALLVDPPATPPDSHRSSPARL